MKEKFRGNLLRIALMISIISVSTSSAMALEWLKSIFGPSTQLSCVDDILKGCTFGADQQISGVCTGGISEKGCICSAIDLSLPRAGYSSACVASITC